MIADEALELSKYMRPGVVLVVGAVDAVEQMEPAADNQPVWRRNRLGIKERHKYPEWQKSFWHYDFWHAFGWVPSIWAECQADRMQTVARRALLASEWEWLRHDSTGLSDIAKWIEENTAPL